MMTLTVSVPLQIDDHRVQYVGPVRSDGRHLVVFIDALGMATSGLAEAHDVRAYHAAIAEADARMACEGNDG